MPAAAEAGQRPWDHLLERADQLLQDHRRAEALQAAEQALQQAQHTLRPQHPDLLPLLTIAGSLQHLNADYAHAQRHFERALALAEVVAAPAPVTADLLNRLGGAQAGQARPDDAEDSHRRALALLEQAAGPDDPQAAQTLRLLGAALESQGRYEDALACYERALAIDAQGGGSSAAEDLQRLADVSQRLGRYDAAQLLWQQADERRMEAVREASRAEAGAPAAALPAADEAPEPSQRLVSRERLRPERLSARPAMIAAIAEPVNITAVPEPAAPAPQAKPAAPPAAEPPSEGAAVVLVEEGQVDDAEPVALAELERSRAEAGASHPDTAVAMNNLAEVYRRQGRLEEAQPLYEDALRLTTDALGPQHPAVATMLSNTAELYRARADYGQAQRLASRALAIRQQALGTAHPDTAASYNNLAVIYQAQGRYTSAESLYHRAHEAMAAQLGGSHPELAKVMTNLGDLYALQGQQTKAAGLYQQALAIYEHTFGASHPGAAEAAGRLAGFTSQGGGQASDASMHRHQRVLAMAAESLNARALMYAKLNKRLAAEELFKGALAIYEKAFGENYPPIAVLLTSYAQLLRKQADRVPEAEQLDARAARIAAAAGLSLGP